MRTLKPSRIVEVLTAGVLGGIAGGAAEIGWIGFYGAATGTPLDPVARGIVVSVFPALAASEWATEYGVLIHLGLAVALGIGLALAVSLLLRRLRDGLSEFALPMLVLMAVWAVNFLLVLPHINPAFVHLLPYGATLFSKLLFGFAAASTFSAYRMHRQRISGR
jgi:hypothetical protein